MNNEMLNVKKEKKLEVTYKMFYGIYKNNFYRARNVVRKNVIIHFHRAIKVALIITVLFASTLYARFNIEDEPKNITVPTVLGAQQLQLGLSTASILNGGATFGVLGGGDILLDNPASAARNLQHSILMQGTGLNQNLSSGLIGYAHVSERGIFSAYVNFLRPYTPGYELGYMLSVSAAFSKLISTIYEFGFRVTFDVFEKENYGNLDSVRQDTNINNFGISADLAFNVQPSFNFNKSVFAFRNFRYGFSIRNAGWLPRLIREDLSTAYIKKIDLFRMGGGFDWMVINDKQNNEKFVSRIVAETGLSYPISGVFSSAIENKFIIEKYGFRSIALHLAYLYDSNLENTLPAIPGITFVFYAKQAEIVLRSAYFVQRLSATSPYDQVSGSVSLEFKFGNTDDVAPEIDTKFFGTEGLINNY